MNNINQIGQMTGTITDHEIAYIDQQVTKAVRAKLVGRTLMPTKSLSSAGFKSYNYYTETDMGQASITMSGESENSDTVVLNNHEVKIPILHKEYWMHWRDVLSRRNSGEDLNTQNATNAALQVAEEEDKLIISGEYTGWPALGIEGLATATGRNTTAGGDWSANYLTYVSTAIGLLEDDGYFGPYRLLVTPAWFAQLRAIIADSNLWAFDAVNKILTNGNSIGTSNIVVTNSLYASDGGVDSALVVDTNPGNFELVVGNDISTYLTQQDNMNYKGKVWEAVVPVIKRPESICEIQSLI